jgi:diadenylate cyclase
MDKDLGTRHRAAIGITEVADAVSVVVSEESGQVSYACNGAIVRNAGPDVVKKALKELLQGDKAAAARAKGPEAAHS